MDVSEALQRKPDESFDDYAHRICQEHAYNGFPKTWQDVADVVNSQWGTSYTESKFRKYWKSLPVTDVNPSSTNEENPYADILAEIKKERVKLSDERTQNNAYIRRISREETLKEIAREAVDKMSVKQILPPYVKKNYSGEAEAILTIGDWHYGIVCDNYWNKYDPDVAEQRIVKLKDEVIRRIQENRCKVIHVVNLSDLISGRIHMTIRLQNRIDVITQIIKVSEIVAEFLADLSNYAEVHYYDCLDNHSRLEPCKEQSIDLESLVRIIPWYLRGRVNSPNIHIHDNEFGDDIINFKCMGYEVVGVHGDRDKPLQVVDNLTLMTHKHYDLVLTAHLHHFGGDEKNQTVVLSNGSLMGTDSYAEKLRLTSRPSQNLIIATKDSVASVIYRILLD